MAHAKEFVPKLLNPAIGGNVLPKGAIWDPGSAATGNRWTLHEEMKSGFTHIYDAIYFSQQPR
jgi:hypothetical protein